MTSRRAAGLTSILAGTCVLIAVPAQAGESAATWDERGRALADQLMSELQAELKQAMQPGGPVAAIEVCRTQAPQIAARLSVSSGAEVGRTALRVRNSANTPDDLERAVMAGFASELEREAAAAVRRDYPQDAATGFEPGELRGAVTVRWPATR